MREYEVEIGGLMHTVQLSDDDAKARGLLADKPASVPAKSTKPADKAAAPANK